MPQKYEQEIDEILRRMEVQQPSQSYRRSLGRRLTDLWNVILTRLAVRPTPTGLMLAGLAIAFLGFILRAFFRGIGTPLAVLAVILFVLALVLSVSQSRRRRSPGWRGRPADYYFGQPLIWDGLVRRYRAWREVRRRRSRF